MEASNPRFYSTLEEIQTEYGGGKRKDRDERESGPVLIDIVGAPTGKLSFSVSMTKNLGDYKSRKAFVSLQVPFKQEELDDVWPQVKKWASKRISKLAKGQTVKASMTPKWRKEPTLEKPSPYVMEVTAGMGENIPLGNFEFISFNLTLTLIADSNEADNAHEFATSWVAKKVSILKNLAQK